MINDIISLLSKKSLSRLFYLISGIMLSILLINEYSGIDIDFSGFEIVYFESDRFLKTNISVICGLMILFLWWIINFLVNITNRTFIDEHDEYRRRNIRALLYTIGDITDLVLSVYAFFYVTGFFDFTYLLGNDRKVDFMICAILCRFASIVWCHFWYRNRAIMDGN